MPKVLGPASLYLFLDGLAQNSQGGEFYVFDLYTFVLTTGATIRLTSADQDITMPAGAYSYSGQTFSAAGPYINRSAIKQSVGFSVDSCEITITSPPGIQLGASTFLAAMAQGQFDGATIQVDRLYQQYWGDFSIGAQPAWFKGQMSTIDELDQAHCKFTVCDKKELLNIMMPWRLYQPPCSNTFGDQGCTIDLASKSVAGTAATGSNASVIQSALTEPGAVPPPLISPTLNYIGALTTGVNLAAPVTYYAVFTTVSANGESTAGPEVSINVTSRAYQPTVNPPTISAYNSGTTYAVGAIVSYGGHYWESLYAANTGNTPGGSTPWWIQLIGLNLYVGTTPGGEQLQGAGPSGDLTPWTFGTTFVVTAMSGTPNSPQTVIWCENGGGLLQGAPPPLINTSGYFTLGTIVFTSGHNQGVSANVANYGTTPGAITVIPPLPYAPATGDAFVITPGCQRDQVTCLNKWNNIANFAGSPTIPLPYLSI